MLKRLRLRLVAVTMALVSLVLAGAFAFLLYSSWKEEKEMTMSALHRIADIQSGQAEPGKPQISRRDEQTPADQKPLLQPTEQRPAGAVATFWALVDANGAVLDYSADEVDISAQTLAAAAQDALAQQREEGALSNPSLRYLVRQTPEGTKIYFADRSTESAAMRALAVNLAVIGAAALAALAGVSVLLASLVLRPVEMAWQQQRQFVADASHELKTPLTVILANTEILLTHPEETVAAQRKWVQGTREEGVRMKKLIDDMLFLAKSDTARVQPVWSRVDWSDVVWSGALSFEAVAFERGVTIDTDIAPGLTLEGDAGQLKQMVAILMDNACKYAAEGSAIRVCLSGSRGAASLRVFNAGEAIPPEALTHIFERFYRTDASRARAAGGYGLGLAIAQSIVQAHKGTIGAQSSAEGVTFTVRLPLFAEKTS